MPQFCHGHSVCTKHEKWNVRKIKTKKGNQFKNNYLREIIVVLPKKTFTKWISGNLKGRPSTPTKGFFKRPQLGKGLIDCKAHSMIWCEPAASLSSSQFSEVKPRLNLSWGQIQGCALSLFDFWKHMDISSSAQFKVGRGFTIIWFLGF